MGLTDLIFRKDDKVVGTVAFDCFISENHRRECEVTEHEIEDGANVSDHIILKPDTLDLMGIVSDTPVVMLASIAAPSPILTDFIGVSDRAMSAHRELNTTMEEGTLIEAITSLGTYTDMVIVSKSVERNASNGNSLECSLSLRKITKVTTQTKTLLSVGSIPENPYDNKTSDKGTKTKTESTSGQSSKSTSILGSIF